MDSESSQKHTDYSGFRHCRKVSVFTVSCELCTRKRGKSAKPRGWIGSSRCRSFRPPPGRPVAVTVGDKIEGLRQWASGRCLSADRAGVHSRTEGSCGGRVRRVVREPGVN
jgi:hypothetical protein